MDLKKIQIETSNGLKSLAKCSDEEFEIFLMESGVNINASEGGWTLSQREMVVGLMMDTLADIMAISEEDSDEQV